MANEVIAKLGATGSSPCTRRRRHIWSSTPSAMCRPTPTTSRWCRSGLLTVVLVTRRLMVCPLGWGCCLLVSSMRSRLGVVLVFPLAPSTVVVNAVAVQPATAGYLTVYPCGSWPGTASVNFAAGEVVANEVIAKLSATGSICVYTSSPTFLVLDAVGYLVNVASTPAAGAVNFALVDGDLVREHRPRRTSRSKVGDILTTQFDLTVAAGAPVGEYTMTLELVDLDEVSSTRQQM